MKRTNYMGHVIVVRRRRTGVRSFSSTFPEYDVYYQSQLLNTFSTMESAKQWIREHGERKRNPGGRKLTKKQRRARAQKRGTQQRIASALKKFIRSNPAIPAALKRARAVGIRRNKNSVTIRVIKLPKVKR